jgi:hypothetical protein
MMEPARLPLTQGRVALVDAEDYPVLRRHSWQWLPNDRTGYAVRSWQTDDGRRVTIYLLRFLLKARPGELVDHANGDGLDNQRSNLRLSNPSQNGANRPAPPRPIPYRGVYRDRRRRNYFAAITVEGRTYRLGTYPTMEAAARAYDAAARRAFGCFARLNFPDELPTVEQLALPLDDDDAEWDRLVEAAARRPYRFDPFERDYYRQQRAARPLIVPSFDWEADLL